MANLNLGKTGRFHDIVWSELEKSLSAREVRRFVQLAGVLEPLSEKEGCTTRGKDLSQYQKLEYFLTASINIGDAFEDLALRIFKEGFPITSYDLAFRAQADSKKNRRGGRVNQGIIEFLFILVIVQLVHKGSTPKEIISKVPETLEKTSSQDTIWLQKMQNLAFEMSGYPERTFPIKERLNIIEYYKRRLEMSVKPSDFFHNSEIVHNFPTLRYMIDCLDELEEELSLADKMKLIYDKVKKKNPNIPSGIVADLNACLIYLIVSCERVYKISN